MLFIARRDIGRPVEKEYVLSTNGKQAKTGRSGRPKVVNEPPWWKPMIWAGCDFFAWNRLLARNRYHIHWSCLHVAIYVFFVSTFHTLLRGVQWVFYGRKVARTSIRKAPIFIVGHWRTGTSLLHELLALDDRHVLANLARPSQQIWEPVQLTLRPAIQRRSWTTPKNRLASGSS